MKTTAALCVVLLAAAATASPLTAFGKTQPRRAEHHPDRDVEEVEPVRTSGPRDESPEIIPFGINLRGLGGAGGRPVLAVRPIGLGPRDSSDEDSDEDPSGGGFLHPYFIDPMSSFMAQMAEMMAAMRRQMDQVLHRLPAEGHTDFSKLGNTTSTTKVVDGHIVTVNDTVIGGDDGDDSEIHIRVVDIRPTESPEGADSAEDSDDAKDSAGSKAGQGAEGEDADTDVEPLNEVTPRPNRADNQIPMKPLKDLKALKRSARSTRRRAAGGPAGPPRGDMTADGGDDAAADEDDVQQSRVPVFDVQQAQVPVLDVQQQQQQQMRMLPAGGAGSNQVDVFDKPSGGRRADLSRDTLVNAILEQQSRRGGLIMVDPDAELMHVRDGKVVRVYGNPAAAGPPRQPRGDTPRPSSSASSSW